MDHHSPVYERMLAELGAGELAEIARKVFAALQAHPSGLTRPQLVAIVFQQATSAVVQNNSTPDRKVRKAIELLRARLVPIVSSSGKAGYRLDPSPEARQALLLELVSRRDRLNSQIEHVQRFAAILASFPEGERAEQGRLF